MSRPTHGTPQALGFGVKAFLWYGPRLFWWQSVLVLELPKLTDLDVSGKKLVESCYSHEKVLNASPQNGRIMDRISYKAIDRRTIQRTIPTVEKEIIESLWLENTFKNNKCLCNQSPTQITMEAHFAARSNKREDFPHTHIPSVLLPPPHVRTVGLLLRFSQELFLSFRNSSQRKVM